MNPKPDIQASRVMANAPSSPSHLPVEPGTRTLPRGAIPADFLFQGSREILIGHKGEHYRLRLTKNGKLILTK